MPEIKNTFRGGKMNKDLNERLVPKGEYRDALNIQVNTSDGSDVGTVQNILSNNLIYQQPGYPSSVTNPSCVGAVADEENNRFYWFVKCDEHDLIIEYSDQLIRLVVVDTNKNVLKFTGDIITGINIIDGLLFWTDNNSEPKKINIENCILGTPDITNHTVLHNRFLNNVGISGSIYTDSTVELLEEHITVIKRAPYRAPTVETTSLDNLNQPGVIDSKRFSDGNTLWGPGSYPTSTSLASDGITPDINIRIRNSSATQDYDIVAGQTIIHLKSVSINDIGIDDDGDNIVDSLKQNFNQNYSYSPDYDIRLKITSVSPYGAQSTSVDLQLGALSGEIDVHCEILSINPNTTVITSAWVVNFEQAADPLFELKFPRFSYRYKYIDGEYSPFSPFTNVVFNPYVYSFDSIQGYNLGMRNYLSKITLKDFVPKSYLDQNLVLSRDIPHDVIGVDLLYKESNSSSVYIVDSVSPVDTQWHDTGTDLGDGVYNITSDTISKILPENQLLRSFDSVPKKALAQEIIGNRLVYGNYTQNMRIFPQDDQLNQFDTSFQYEKTNTPIVDEIGAYSLKTLRDYQLGVVYEDKYGRQTPILTNKNTTLKIPILESSNQIRFKATINSLMPSEAETFKFFIKETASQYYNLSLSRWYNALDGNIWLSFSSSDRNKIDEEDYLYLKKSHGADTPILTPNKYKVLAIENEAPDYIKTERLSLGSITHSTTNLLFSDFTFYPLKDKTNFRLDKSLVESSGFAGFESKPDLEMHLRLGSNSSDRYKITNVKLDDLNPVVYIVQIDGKFGSDVNFIEDSSSTLTLPVIKDAVVLEITTGKEKNQPEFDGKFFVKVAKDFNFTTFVLNETNNADDLAILHQEPLHYFLQSTLENTNDHFSETGGNDFDLDGGSPVLSYTAAHNRAKTLFGDGTTSSTLDSNGPSWFIDGLNHEGEPVYKPSGLVDQEGNSTPGVSLGDNQSSIDISFGGIRTPGDYLNNLRDDLWWIVGDVGNEKHDEEITMIRHLVAGSKFYYSSDPDKKIFTIVNVEITNLYNFADGIQANPPGTDPSKVPASLDELFFKPWNRRKRYRIFLDDTNANTNVGIAGSNLTDTVTLNFVGKVVDSDGSKYTSKNPAVFETKPKNTENIEIYHEASRSFDKTMHGEDIALDWFNCYIFGNGVESNRIQDDFNAAFIDNGPKVSAVFEGEYKEEKVKNRLIFSGIYNSKNSVNRTNEFIIAEKITKDLNPIHGGIQKLHARDTDLVVLCEDKIFKVLANKDALYNADGNFQLISNENVLGQVIPFSGEYGISTDPESFAHEAYRSYFTDKKRGVVLRLSKDGLTPISEYGMSDYFSDELKDTQKIVGSYDAKKNNYNLTLTKTGFSRDSAVTITYDEKVRGWSSFKSFQPELGISLNSDYYTFSYGAAWKHHVGPTYNMFYSVQSKSTVTFLLNDASGSIKSFNTLNYEGSQSQVQVNAADNNYYNINPEIGWYADYISTDIEDGYVNEFIKKEGKWFNYIKGQEASVLTNQFTFQGIGLASPTGAPPRMFNLTIGDLTADPDPTI